MMNVTIEKCIGCGLCVKDCFPNDINIVDGKARFKNVTCIKCGHCIAVCPKGAISTDEYNMDEVKEFHKDEFIVDADNLMNFIKFRRTIRQFQDKKVEKDKLLKIIEAGRFTQTGSNMQDVSYIVVEDKLPEFKALAFESLRKMGETYLANIPEDAVNKRRYPEMWIKMHEEFLKNPQVNDKLFFHAPVIIVITANSEFNGALASSNMELMTNALGLGTFFSGFFVGAAKSNKEILDLLEVKDGKQIVACMVIGYPNVKYVRTVPRKEAEVSWK